MEHEHLYNDQEKAQSYMISLCSEMEGDQDALFEASKFFMRQGPAGSERALLFLKDAYSFGIKNLDIALTYGSLLI
jgi:hypothetical protein